MFNRGHFEVSIIPPRTQVMPVSLRLNTALAERYVTLLRSLSSSLALEGDVTLDLVARLRPLVEGRYRLLTIYEPEQLGPRRAQDAALVEAGPAGTP